MFRLGFQARVEVSKFGLHGHVSGLKSGFQASVGVIVELTWASSRSKDSTVGFQAKYWVSN